MIILPPSFLARGYVRWHSISIPLFKQGIQSPFGSDGEDTQGGSISNRWMMVCTLLPRFILRHGPHFNRPLRPGRINVKNLIEVRKLERSTVWIRYLEFSSAGSNIFFLELFIPGRGWLWILETSGNQSRGLIFWVIPSIASFGRPSAEYPGRFKNRSEVLAVSISLDQVFKSDDGKSANNPVVWEKGISKSRAGGRKGGSTLSINSTWPQRSTGRKGGGASKGSRPFKKYSRMAQSLPNSFLPLPVS